MLRLRARITAHDFGFCEGEIMKIRMVLIAVVLSIAAAAKADNPSDAPLLSDRGAFELSHQERATRAAKKERVKTHQTSEKQARVKAPDRRSSGGMY